MPEQYEGLKALGLAMGAGIGALGPVGWGIYQLITRGVAKAAVQANAHLEKEIKPDPEEGPDAPTVRALLKTTQESASLAAKASERAARASEQSARDNAEVRRHIRVMQEQLDSHGERLSDVETALARKADKDAPWDQVERRKTPRKLKLPGER